MTDSQKIEARRLYVFGRKNEQQVAEILGVSLAAVHAFVVGDDDDDD